MSTDMTSKPAVRDVHEVSEEYDYVMLVAPTQANMLDRGGNDNLIPALHCEWLSDDYPDDIIEAENTVVTMAYNACMSRGTAGLTINPIPNWPDRVRSAIDTHKHVIVATSERVVAIGLCYNEPSAPSPEDTLTCDKKLKIFTGDATHRGAWVVPVSKSVAASNPSTQGSEDKPSLEGTVTLHGRTDTNVKLLAIPARELFPTDAGERDTCSQDVWDKWATLALAYSMNAHHWKGWGLESVSMAEYTRAGGEWPPDSAQSLL